MTPELSAYEKRLARAIPAWAVVRVLPAASAREAVASRPVGYHLTRASAAEDQERRGGPPGAETEGFEVRPGTLLEALERGAFSPEEVRRVVERETEPLEPEEQMAAARIPLWTVWHEDRLGPREDRDPLDCEAHFFTQAEAETYASARGGAATGYTVTGGTLLEGVTSRLIPVNAQARELIATFPPELEERMFERVREFVAKAAGIAAPAISRETRIVDDLGVSGREGARLMAEFFEAFGVNPLGFEVTHYFAPEKLGLLGSISTLMREGPPRRELTVDELVGAALVARWL